MVNWANKEEVKNYHKNYQKTHRKIINKRQKRYALNHKEYYAFKNKEHNLKNKLNGYFNKKKLEYSRKNPKKIYARNYANNKKLIGNKCEICKSKNNLNIHHKDYSKPNNIITLCIPHHIELHKKC